VRPAWRHDGYVSRSERQFVVTNPQRKGACHDFEAFLLVGVHVRGGHEPARLRE
jgi:hypothetical protein